MDMYEIDKENTPVSRGGRRCVAGGCSNTTYNGVSMHNFPGKRPNIHRQWVAFVRRKRKDWEPSRYSVLCSAHFEEDCYPLKFRLGLFESIGKTVKKILKEDAVPTILNTVTTPTMPTATMPTPGKRSSRPETDLETPKTVKRPRSAFVKRDIQRMIRDYEECEQEETLCPQTPTHKPSEDDLSPSMEVTIDLGEPKTKSVASQKSLSRPPMRSHYTQTRSKGKDKGCQAVGPKTREIGIMCDIIPSPQRQHVAQRPHVTTIPLPDPSPVNSEPGSFTSENPGGRDWDYQVESDMSSDSEGEDDRKQADRHFLVGEEKLLELFHKCPRCAQFTNGQIKNIQGSCITVEQDCGFCHYNRKWTSQTMVGSVPSGNLAISCGLLYSGSLPTKILRFLDFINIPSISYSTYMNHQRHYMQPVILEVWENYQDKYYEETRNAGKQICIGGDGRADTPGHSAKYGSYTVMDLDSAKVIDVQLVQSNEVKSSCHMEKEGLLRAIQQLNDEDIQIKTIVTDRHVQIKKWVRENMTDTQHCFDVWHVAKGLKKKLVALSKEKDCGELHAWIKSILNHLYWVASSTPDSNADVMLQKWASIGNHIQNIHHGHGSLFPSCTHPPLDPSRRIKKWLKPATKVNEKLGLILSSPYLKRDIPMLSNGQQTSHLEAYHSVINHFAPKMIGFSYHGMQSRLLLAALHFNENVLREQASLVNGEKRYSITFPKQKNGDYTVRQIRTECTFNYVEDLMEKTKERVKLMRIPECKVVGESPPPLCMNFVHPEKSEAVSGLISRFRH